MCVLSFDFMPNSVELFAIFMYIIVLKKKKHINLKTCGYQDIFLLKRCYFAIGRSYFFSLYIVARKWLCGFPLCRQQDTWLDFSNQEKLLQSDRTILFLPVVGTHSWFFLQCFCNYLVAICGLCLHGYSKNHFLCSSSLSTTYPLSPRTKAVISLWFTTG